MIRGTQIKIGALPSYRLGQEPYNPNQLGLGPLMLQEGNAGNGSFAGPFSISMSRPMEASVAIPYTFPTALRWSESATSQWDWVFMADAATAANTRRLGMYRFNRLTGVTTYDGFITVTFPGTAEAKTIRGLRADYVLETTGTVAVSGTALTGVGTQFQANRVSVGNRIGFGSTNPDAIAQWFEIGAIASDTGITLTTTAGTIAAGTPYVIEDLSLLMIVTSVTTNLGGLYVVKGLRRETFSATGTTVPAATTVDRIRACYHLRDAATGTALVSFGASLEDGVDPTTRHMYVLETLANPVLFKFNIRAALTVVGGSSTSAFVLKTGSGGAMVGTVSQLNNGRLARANHGPGQGLDCIYFTTTTRIYRTADVSTITQGSTSWLIDNMTEVPPGGAVTYPLTSVMQSIEYSGFMDRFIVIGAGTAGARSYITEYRTDGGQMDRIILADFKQLDHSIADSATTPFPSINASSFSVWVEGGIGYFVRNNTTSSLNQFYAVPLGADWEYAAATNCRLILPAMNTPNASSYVSALSNQADVIGGTTGRNLGMSPQPIRGYYRTAGIADNSGGWTLLTGPGQLSGVAGAAQIQLMFEFRMDNTLIPGRLFGAAVLFNDTSMSDNWQGSSNIGTNLSTKTFGFRHSLAYGSAVPRLAVELFDAETGNSLGTDDSTTQAWTWGKSVNAGAAWTAYNTTDRANADTYIRVTPASLADNIKVRAVIREF
jgi:hypothetical protein